MDASETPYHSHGKRNSFHPRTLEKRRGGHWRQTKNEFQLFSSARGLNFGLDLSRKNALDYSYSNNK